MPLLEVIQNQIWVGSEEEGSGQQLGRTLLRLPDVTKKHLTRWGTINVDMRRVVPQDPKLDELNQPPSWLILRGKLTHGRRLEIPLLSNRGEVSLDCNTNLIAVVDYKRLISQS